jgi:transcriptional regulator with XRE-family HTH domain
MIEQETQAQFVVLRGQGKTFAAIAEELGVSRGTLVNWSRKFRFELQNLQAIRMEELRNKVLSTTEDRVNDLAGELHRVEEEIKKRDYSDVPTARLLSMAESLRRQIVRETGAIQFTTPVNDMPNDEYFEAVQDWNP